MTSLIDMLAKRASAIDPPQDDMDRESNFGVVLFQMLVPRGT